MLLTILSVEIGSKHEQLPTGCAIIFREQPHTQYNVIAHFSVSAFQQIHIDDTENAITKGTTFWCKVDKKICVVDSVQSYNDPLAGDHEMPESAQLF